MNDIRIRLDVEYDHSAERYVARWEVDAPDIAELGVGSTFEEAMRDFQEAVDFRLERKNKRSS